MMTVMLKVEFEIHVCPEAAQNSIERDEEET